MLIVQPVKFYTFQIWFFFFLSSTGGLGLVGPMNQTTNLNRLFVSVDQFVPPLHHQLQ